MESSAIANFIGRSILKYRKFKITFVPQKYIVCERVRTGGIASETELRVATKHALPSWLEVFVHETCHLDQQIEQPPWFAEAEASISKMNEWLAGKPVKCIKKHIIAVIRLEHDCEVRTVRKLVRNKLPVDLKEYCQMANAYILGHHWILANRKWCKKSYETTKVWSRMPTKIISLKMAFHPSARLLSWFDGTPSE